MNTWRFSGGITRQQALGLIILLKSSGADVYETFEDYCLRHNFLHILYYNGFLYYGFSGLPSEIIPILSYEELIDALVSGISKS